MSAIMRLSIRRKILGYERRRRIRLDTLSRWHRHDDTAVDRVVEDVLMLRRSERDAMLDSN